VGWFLVAAARESRGSCTQTDVQLKSWDVHTRSSENRRKQHGVSAHSVCGMKRFEEGWISKRYVTMPSLQVRLELACKIAGTVERVHSKAAEATKEYQGKKGPEHDDGDIVHAG